MKIPVGEREMTLLASVAVAAATLAWTRWRHDDRSGVATRWRDLPAPARYYRAIRGSIATGGCFFRRRRGRRVGAEPSRVGSDVLVFDIVVFDIAVLSSSSKRGKVYAGAASVFPPISFSVRPSRFTGNFSPVFGVTVSWVKWGWKTRKGVRKTLEEARRPELNGNLLFVSRAFC